MNLREMMKNDCCLLTNISLNSERIVYLLECRFKRNSSRTSFDGKAFLPEKPSNNTKISCSLLNLYPRVIKTRDKEEEYVSSEDESELIASPKSVMDPVDDDYLDKLAQWEPNKSPQSRLESDEEEIEENIPQGNDETTNVDPVDLSTEIPATQAEDLLVTFVHYPVKPEPITNDFDLPQLDGHTDVLFDNNQHQQKRNESNIKTSKRLERRQIHQKKPPNQQSENPTIHSHQQLPSSQTKNSLSEDMILAEQKLNTHRKIKSSKTFPVNIPTLPKKRTRRNNKLNKHLPTKKRSQTRRKNLLSMVNSGRTLLDYFKVIKRSSTNHDIPYSSSKSSINQTRKRPSNYFDKCIVIDDDDNDMQETEQSRSSMPYNLHTREKLLDHIVHSSEMRIKWLLNVELILLEYISLYHIQPVHTTLEKSHITSSFISLLILNFLKIFIIRYSTDDDDEFSFHQFGFLSYFPYLLIDLPTFNHPNLHDDNDCSECHQYSLILNILFDLLRDLIENDLCEISHPGKSRSSLIEEDYFHQMKLIKKNPFYRIKLMIYFIELIGIHRNKCSNKKQEFCLNNEKKILQWMEEFLRQIISQRNNLIHQKISICFNVMDLCLLFINERENGVKQMAGFLTELCEENPAYMHLFLFDENLLADIRLLLINELIGKTFNMKLISMDCIEELFHRIDPMDDMTLLLVRSLFNTYADLIIDLKHSMLIDSTISEGIISIFRHQLQSIYLTLLNLSHESHYFEQIKRTVILFRLLQCKWNRL